MMFIQTGEGMISLQPGDRFVIGDINEISGSRSLILKRDVPGRHEPMRFRIWTFTTPYRPYITKFLDQLAAWTAEDGLFLRRKDIESWLDAYHAERQAQAAQDADSTDG